MTEFYKEHLKNITINKMMEEPKKLLNGLFSIGYDVSNGKDHCCLIVAQPRGNTLLVINEFYDEEANEIFKKLIG